MKGCHFEYQDTPSYILGVKIELWIYQFDLNSFLMVCKGYLNNILELNTIFELYNLWHHHNMYALSRVMLAIKWLQVWVLTQTHISKCMSFISNCHCSPDDWIVMKRPYTHLPTSSLPPPPSLTPPSLPSNYKLSLVHVYDRLFKALSTLGRVKL